jgi:hypothetical protein
MNKVEKKRIVHRPNGTSVVTGYEIVKKTEEKSERNKE